MGCLSSKAAPPPPQTQTQPVKNEVRAPSAVSSPQEKQSTPQETAASPENARQQACFGAGCYWGTEKYFSVEFCRRRFPEAMIKGQVGFMGPPGSKENPTYQEVCRGDTGHVEVFCFSFLGGHEMYRELVKFFFQFHDPSVPNAQGNDTGSSYASVVFAYDATQRRIAEEVIAQLKGYVADGTVSCYKEKAVTTVVMDSNVFFPAHEEHQEYLAKNPNGYCNHRMRLKEWPGDVATQTAS